MNAPEKGRFRSTALKVERGSPLVERNGFDEDSSFQNSTVGVESHEKDGCCMGSRGRGRIKENEKDTRMN